MLKKWLLASCLVLTVWSAAAQSTLISFKAADEPIVKVLERFSSSCDLSLAYSPSFFSKDATVTLNQQNRPPLDVLQQILVGTGISFRQIRNNRIVLSRAKVSYHTISGYVQDLDSKERLFGATLYSSAAEKGTSTNEYGFFSLKLPAGTHQVNVDYLGYSSSKIVLKLERDVKKDIDLKSGLTMKAITITPEDNLGTVAKSKHGLYQLNERAMRKAPRVGGVNDLVGASSMIPGFVNSQEGLGGLHVRGGSTGQNQMLMDGAPIYIPYHLLGLFSVYNSRTIQTAKLYKGSFSPRYGGSVSSIFDVRIKEGDKTRWSADAGINLIHADLLVQGPIFKGRGSVLVAGRSTYGFNLLDKYFNRVFLDGYPGNLDSNFSDFNFKANYSINKRNHLYLSRYEGSDNFGRFYEFEVENEFEEEEELEFESEFLWDNAVTALRWNHEFSSKAFMNATLTNSKYTNNYKLLEEDSFVDSFFYLDNRVENSETGLKLDLDFAQSEKHQLRVGIGFNFRTFDSGFSTLNSDDLTFEPDTLGGLEIEDFSEFVQTETYSTNEGFVYLEDQFRLKDIWSIGWGVRASGFLNEYDGQFHLEPRFTSSLSIAPQFTWNVSTSKMVQYLHLVNNGVIRLPNDIWMPVRGDIKPQVAWHYETGLDIEINSSSSLSFDVYLKKMTNLYALPETIDYLIASSDVNIQTLVSKGKGQSRGLELFYNWIGSRKTLTAGYSLSKSSRQFPGHNGGKTYPYEYDHRHSLNLTGSIEVSDKLSLNSSIQFFSSTPKLFVSESILTNTVDPSTIGLRNQERGKSYHRLDINLNYKKQAKHLLHELTFGLTNALDRKNVTYYLSSSNQEIPVNSIPIKPNISYRISY